MNPPSPADVIICACHLARFFDDGRIKALNGIDLEVHAGELLAITGPSGCGKSSLLNLIGTLDTPTAGTIAFRSEPYTAIRDQALFRRRHIGFIFQSFHLIPTLSALDNVMVATIGCPGSGKAKLGRARGLLARLGLSDRLDQFPSRMSGGERQRVAIARALINDPDLILADEPTGSLDSATGRQVLDLLAELRRERGLTMIVATHDPNVSAWVDRVVPVRDGRLDEQAERHP